MIPFFSIVIPLYNKEKYVQDTIKSVLNQTFTNFEVIIVNDGSTDRSLQIVKLINDHRIRIINQENHGLCTSRNNGIKASNGEFIAFLDADDLWAEDFLQTIYNLIIAHQEYSVFATNIKPFISTQKISLSSKIFNPKQIQIISNYFKILKSIIGPSSLVVKKVVFNKVGFFDETINYGEENDFYIRCFMLYHFIYYQEPKTYYRTGLENQLTSPNKNFNRKIPNYEAYLKIYNHKDLNKFLDFVHYNLVVLYKMEKNFERVRFFKHKVSPKNLSIIQKLKYYLPTRLFYFIKKAYLSIKKQ